MPAEILSHRRMPRALSMRCNRRAKSLGVSDVEALFGAHFGALTRFANNTIHQNVAEQDRWISVRVALDHKNRARHHQPIRSRFHSRRRLRRPWRSPGPQRPIRICCRSTNPPVISETKRFDPATASATPEHRGKTVAEAIRIVESAGQTAAGIYSTGQSVEAIFNSRGVAAWHAETMAQFSITAMAGDSSGWAKASAVSQDAIDPLALARSAAEKARLSHEPHEIAPGRYTVILEPAAVLDLVGQMFGDFSATAVADSRSFLTDRVGKKLFGDNIHISDDVAHPLQAGVPFDGEGVPRRKLTLVEAGVPRELAYARSSAQRAGVEPTGHGFPLPNEVGEAPLNIVIAGGSATVDQMISVHRSRHSCDPAVVHPRSGSLRKNHDRHDPRRNISDRKWPCQPRPAQLPLQSGHHRAAEQRGSAFAFRPRLRRRGLRHGGRRP